MTETEESKSTSSSNEKSVHSTKTNESIYFVIDRDEQTNMNETIEKLVMRELKKARANEDTKNIFNQQHSSGLKKLKVKFMHKLMDKKMREFMQQQMQQQNQTNSNGKESGR